MERVGVAGGLDVIWVGGEGGFFFFWLEGRLWVEASCGGLSGRVWVLRPMFFLEKGALELCVQWRVREGEGKREKWTPCGVQTGGGTGDTELFG